MSGWRAFCSQTFLSIVDHSHAYAIIGNSGGREMTSYGERQCQGVMEGEG